MRETIQIPLQTSSEFNVNMHSQLISLKVSLRLAVDRFAPPVQRVASAMGAICVFMFISLWLVGPGTNAGAFDYARLLVPGIASCCLPIAPKWRRLPKNRRGQPKVFLR